MSLIKPKPGVETILSEAVEIDSETERRLFVERACAGDEALCKEVQRLIGNHLRAGSFLESPAVSVAVTIDSSNVCETVGNRIGPYKLRELLGEGGMGSVFVAEQEKPVRRKVALKIIKPGMGSREVISRFESERQALALMDHPNIARVLEAGTTGSGLPYFVMELVRGTPITEHCDTYKLGNRERLGLFLQVCEAAQHAHQKGIIHRDLKPSNILVAMNDTTPVIKVIDFGIAKAMGQQLSDNTVYTGFSQMIGTPLYMSPEQAGQSNIDIDTRSDIYSLGVLLYELLTGSKPFESDMLQQAGYDEMRRMIRELDPPRPSARISTLHAAALSTIAACRKIEPRKFSQQLRGELDWIVMKALEKDRNRRYETAIGLGRDVQRYLADEPIEARPASAGYRLKKLLRRNRGLATATTLLVVGLVVTTVLSLMLAVRERELAQRRQVVQHGITSVLADVTRLRRQPKTDSKGAQESLAQAREQLQRAVALAEVGPSPSDIKEQVQSLLHELDQEYLDGRLLGVFDEAWLAKANTDPAQGRWAPEQCIPILTKALEARGIRVGQTPIDEVVTAIWNMPASVRAQFLVALEEWADCQSIRLGTILRRIDVVSTNDSNLPETNVRYNLRLDRIVGIGLGPDGRIVDTQANTSLMRLGVYLSPELGTVVRLRVIRRGQLEAETYEVVPDPILSWLNKVVKAADGDPWRQRMREAYDLTDKVELRNTFEKLADEADLARQPVRTLTRLSDQLVSLEVNERALELSRQIQRRFPGDVHANTNLATILKRAKPPRFEESARYYTAAIALCTTSACTHNNLGVVLSDLGKPDEAIEQYREALKFQPNFFLATSNIYSLLKKQGKQDEANAELRNFIRLNPDNGRARYTLGTAYLNQGKLEQAVAELQEAARLEPNESPVRINLASALRKQGKLDEAISQYREVLRILPAAMEFHVEIADVLQEQGRLEDAISEFNVAVRTVPNSAEAQNTLAWFLATTADANLRDPAQALALSKKAVGLAPKDPALWNTLGVAYYRNGEWRDAITSLKKSEELMPEGRSENWIFLAMSYWQRDEPDKAREMYDKVVEWMKNKPVSVELKRFREEANELLGIANKPDIVKEDLKSLPVDNNNK